MTSEEFKNWRKENGFRSREAAAKALGISVGSVLNYEIGHRREDPTRLVEIPLNIALACAAISAKLEPAGEREQADIWERSRFEAHPRGLHGVALLLKRDVVVSSCRSESAADAAIQQFKADLDAITPAFKKKIREFTKRPLFPEEDNTDK